MDMINAKRVVGKGESAVTHTRQFSSRQWNSKTGPQSKGWVLATSNLELEKEEAKAGRGSANPVYVAMQEELQKASDALASAKAENETLSIENAELKERVEKLTAENEILAANQKKSPGRKTSEG